MAKSKEEILSAVKQFNRSTMVIPPGEWNPKIRIEPPEKFLSKVLFFPYTKGGYRIISINNFSY